MRLRSRSLPAAGMVALASACAAPDQAGLSSDTAYVEGSAPAVIAFLPPPSSAAPAASADADADAAATRNQVEAAVADTRACLGSGTVTYRIVRAQRIIVRGAARDESFDLGHTAPLVGALLLRPGMNPRILFACGGPQALGRMLRPAASEYFGIPCIG